MSEDLELQLSIEEVNTLLSGLGMLPANQSMELIFKIRQQAQEQLPTPDEQKGGD